MVRPHLTEADLLAEQGSGDYRILLLDGNRQICETKVSFRDPERPPVIDPVHVVLSDPANKDVVAQMRARGIKFPDDADTTVEMVKEALRSNNAQHPPPAAADGANHALSLVAEGARQSISLISDLTRSQLLQQPTQQNNLEQIIQVANLLRPQSDPALQEMARQTQALLETMNRRMEQVEQLARNPLPAAAAIADPLLDRARERMLEKFDEFMEGTGAAAPGAPAWIGAILPHVGKMVDAAQLWVRAYAANAHAAAAGAYPNPQPPPPPYPQYPAPPQVPGSPPQMHHQTPPTSQPVPPHPDQSQSTTTEEAEMRLSLIMNVIRHPFAKNWKAGGDGTDFAAWLVAGYGEEALTQVRSLPNAQELLVNLLSQDPVLGTLVSADMPRLQATVEEFLAYDPSNEEEDEEEQPQPQQQPEQPPPPAAERQRRPRGH